MRMVFKRCVMKLKFHDGIRNEEIPEFGYFLLEHVTSTWTPNTAQC